MIVSPYKQVHVARPLHAGPIPVVASNPIYGQPAFRSPAIPVGWTPQAAPAVGGVQYVKQRPGAVIRPSEITGVKSSLRRDPEILAKINEVLDKGHDLLKSDVYEVFESIATQGQQTLDFTGLKKFQTAFSKKLGTPEEAFGDLKDDYTRFDFNGDNTLQAHETYRLVKNILRKYRKELGYTTNTVNVPLKTLQSEGYQVVRQLGKGAQGEASLANHTPTGKQYCVKRLQKDPRNAVILDELKDEYQILHSLHNERIQKIYDIFQDSMYYYLIQEPYFGRDFESLHQGAKEQGVALTSEYWKNLFSQCLEALQYMHKHAIMHCDIKEGNIMLKHANLAQPDAVVVDFGVAQHFLHPKYDQLRGTPGYLPPETWQRKKWFPKGDAFSMGVTMVQMVLDSRPKETPQGVKGGVFCDGARSLEDVERLTCHRVPMLRDMPPDLQNVCRRMLEKDMLKRMGPVQALEDPCFSAKSSLPAAGNSSSPLIKPASPPLVASPRLAPSSSAGAVVNGLKAAPIVRKASAITVERAPVVKPAAVVKKASPITVERAPVVKATPMIRKASPVTVEKYQPRVIKVGPQPVSSGVKYVGGHAEVQPERFVHSASMMGVRVYSP